MPIEIAHGYTTVVELARCEQQAFSRRRSQMVSPADITPIGSLSCVEGEWPLNVRHTWPGRSERFSRRMCIVRVSALTLGILVCRSIA
jgi:hypothetical protein